MKSIARAVRHPRYPQSFLRGFPVISRRFSEAFQRKFGVIGSLSSNERFEAQKRGIGHRDQAGERSSRLGEAALMSP